MSKIKDEITPRRALGSSNGNQPTKVPVRLPFHPAFQSKLLLLCLEQPEWLAHLKAGWFDAPLEGRVFTVLERLYSQTGKTMTLRILADACIREMGKPSARNVLRPLSKMKLTEADRAYLLNELPKFTRYQTIGDSLVRAAQLYQNRDVDGLVEEVGKANSPLPNDARLTLTPMTAVKTKAYQWIWKYRIARGKLHLTGGEPGHGKSAEELDLLARFSRGTAWPDGAAGSGKPGVTVLISAEDDAEDTIKPRLIAAGADMRYIYVRDVKAPGVLSLVSDLGDLERLLIGVKADQLLIDSINDFLPKLNISQINDVKTVMNQWASLAARLNIAIKGITHLSKAHDRSAAQRFIGSTGFLASARLSFLVAPDSEDLRQERKLVVSVKPNIAPSGFMAVPPLGFTLRNTRVNTDDGGTTEVPKVMWVPVHRRVDPTELLHRLQNRDRPQNIVARLLKHETLTGPKKSEALIAAVKAEGGSKKTARRVKKKMHMEAFRHQGHWYWTPPGWSKKQVNEWIAEESSQMATEGNGHLEKKRSSK